MVLRESDILSQTVARRNSMGISGAEGTEGIHSIGLVPPSLFDWLGSPRRGRGRKEPGSGIEKQRVLDEWLGR